MAVNSICVFQQRMLYFGSSTYPFTGWATAAGEPDMLYADRPMIDSGAFSFTIPSARAASIKHALAARRCLVFTEGAVYSIEGTDEGFGYRTIQVKEVSGIGANDAEPIGLANSIIFAGTGGRELLELQYDITQDGMLPLQRIVLADHLTESAAIVKMAYQLVPEGVVWCMLDNGKLLAFTCLPEHDVFAWTRQSFGGGAVVTDIIGTGCVPASVSGIKSASEIYAVVKQGARTMLVKLRGGINSSNPEIEKGLCLDLMQRVTLAAPAAALWPAVPYPKDETLQAVNLQSGELVNVIAAADGSLAAPAALPAGLYAVGYQVAGGIELMPAESAEGSLQGMRKNCVEMRVLTHRCSSPRIAPIGNGQPFVGAGVPRVFEGRYQFEDLKAYEIVPYGRVSEDGRLAIRSDSPYPSEILSVITTLELEGR